MALNNILLEGDRHSGKTHLIGRIVKRYNGIRQAGFFTFKDKDGIVYFRAWDSAEVDEQNPPQIVYSEHDRIVRYHIFEDYGTRAVEHAIANAELMIFDELGRFEQNCELFTNALRRALVCNAPVLASLKSESNPFLNSLKNRKDCSVYSLTKNNREKVFVSVARALDSRLFSI
jgi:nucleoside-triphosphatase THEP1